MSPRSTDKGYFSDSRLVLFPCLILLGLLLGPLVSMTVAGRTLMIRATEPLLLLFALVALWHNIRVPRNTFFMVQFAFSFWALASVLWSRDFLRTSLGAVHMLEAMCLSVLSYHAFRADGAHRFVTALRAFGVLLTAQIIWSLTQAWQSLPALVFYGVKSLVDVPLGGSNYLAIFLNFGIAFELFARPRYWPIIAAIQSVGLLGTFSRAGLVTLGLVLIMWALSRVTRFLPSLLLGGITCALLPLTGEGRVIVDSFSSITTSAISRLRLWQQAASIIMDTPLIGVGFGAFQATGGELRDPHNTILELASELGIIGLALFMALLATVFVMGARAARGNGIVRGLVVGLAAVVIESMVEPFFLDASSAIWTALVSTEIVALCHLARQQQRVDPETLSRPPATEPAG